MGLPKNLLEAAQDPSICARFLEKFEVSDGCWLWNAAKDQNGYGNFSVYGRSRGPVKAQRFSFAYHHQKDPDGFDVCHSCDNPPCINPAHLFLGTHHENMLDSKEKGRMKIASKGKKGSLNNQAKLTEVEVMKIIALIGSGVSNSGIARTFNVDRSTIYLIKTKKKWRHLHGESE